MHIAFIEDTPLHGGTQIWVIEATKEFLDKGDEVTVLAPRNSYVANHCQQAGARVFTYDYDQVIKEQPQELAIWRDALEPCKVAVTTVHPPRNGFHCAVFAAKCIKTFSLQTILLPKTGTIVPEYKREFYAPDDAVATHVISITGFTRKYLIEHYKIPEEKVSLIYQGTELERFQCSEEQLREAQKRYPLPSGAGPVLASLGSIEERKGQKVLLQAIRLLKERYRSVHLMFVGDGPDEDELKQQTKDLGLENNVSFFPFTTEPMYPLEITDILMLPSLRKEGLPNVILEAMAMKKPTVASNIAGIPEVVKNGITGYLVEPGSAEELTEAVVKVWENKNHYRQLCDNAFALINEQMNKKRQFAEFRSFFGRL